MKFLIQSSYNMQSKPRNPLVPASILKKAGKNKDKKKETKDQPIKGE